MINIEKWDKDYLSLAEFWANKKSKDPSTKVGAIIVRPDLTVASIGYNGFPRKIKDTEDRLNNREIKYSLMVHAEINAILNAKEPLNGYTLYTYPFMPCDRCIVQVIQAGIKRIVSLKNNNERWEKAFNLSLQLAKEAEINVILY